jgi:hypothetical protein
MKPEEVKAPEVPKQEYEIRKKDKKTTVAIAVNSQSHALPANARNDFHKKESDWFGQDHAILDFKATKNELESFTYELKTNLESYGPYEAYLEPAKRAETLQRLQQTIDWIYGDGKTAPAQQFKDRLDHFKQIGKAVRQRYLLRSEFPFFQEQFNNYSQEINDMLANSATMGDETRQDIMTKYTEMESYFNVVQQMLGSKLPHEDVGISVSEVQNKYENFKIVIHGLFTAPPPPKPQPKAPEPAAA